MVKIKLIVDEKHRSPLVNKWIKETEDMMNKETEESLRLALAIVLGGEMLEKSE